MTLDPCKPLDLARFIGRSVCHNSKLRFPANKMVEAKPTPVFVNGQQIRVWLHVEDHAWALCKVGTEGQKVENYNIGGHKEKTNLEVVRTLFALLNEVRPDHPKRISSYKKIIAYVADLPGHYQRYAIDASRIQKDFRWVLAETLETGLRKAVKWYLYNVLWCQNLQDCSYHRQRLGFIECKYGAVA